MINLDKFIKALELVKVGGLFSMGLAINDGAQKTSPRGLKGGVISQISGKDENTDKEIFEMHEAIDSGKWLVLRIGADLPATIYSQLRLLSAKNRMQFIRDDEVIDCKQTDKTRIIVEIKKDALKEIDRQYPEFRNLFGPVMRVE